MRKYYGCHLVLIVALWSILGSLIFPLGFNGYLWLPLGEWVQVAKFPTNQGSIIGYGDFFELFLVADNDGTYKCDLRKGNCTLVPPIAITTNRDICPGRHHPIPKPPGKVISSKEFHFCGGDVNLQENFVLLDDSSIWEWSSSYGWGEGLITVALFILGGLFGFVGGMMYSLVRRNHIAKLNQPSANPRE